MSQFGMQMPGGRAQRSAGPDVYTALMFVGTVAMVVAIALLWIAASKVSPSDNPFAVQDPDSVKIKQ